MKISQTLGSHQLPRLYLVHGWGLHSKIMHEWGNTLSRWYHVHLLDLPGHGTNLQQEMPDDIESCNGLVDCLPPGIWVGWSLGGLLTLNIALHRPKKVKNLIMLCSTPCFIHKPQWVYGIEKSILQQFGTSIKQDIKQTILKFIALEVMGSGDEKQQLEYAKQHIFSKPMPSQKTLLSGLKLLQQTNLTEQLKKLTMPSLWLAGRRDRIVRTAAIKAASKLCGGQYHVVKGAGHAPFINHGNELTNYIQDFLCH